MKILRKKVDWGCLENSMESIYDGVYFNCKSKVCKLQPYCKQVSPRFFLKHVTKSSCLKKGAQFGQQK